MTNPFSSVPAILPDWSNAEKVYAHIDYDILTVPENNETLEKISTFGKIEELTPNQWYAVKRESRRWWLVYYDGVNLFTPYRNSYVTEIIKCVRVGNYVRTVPVSSSVMGALPDQFKKLHFESCFIGVDSDERYDSLNSLLRSIDRTTPPIPDVYRHMEEFHEIAHRDHFSRTWGIALPSSWPASVFTYPDVLMPKNPYSPPKPSKGYDPDAVGYVSREDTKCDEKKALSDREKAKRNKRRMMAKKSRKQR